MAKNKDSANTARLAVIPRPRLYRELPGNAKRFHGGKPVRIFLKKPGQTDTYAAETLAAALGESFGLRASVQTMPAKHNPPELSPRDIFLWRGKSIPLEFLPRSCSKKKALENPEGYVIFSGLETPVTAFSRTETGLLYAVQTLRQLFTPEKGGACLGNLEIADYPDFSIRGNNWNLFAEIGGASYDRGDGPVAYEKRIIRKLDMCAAYKINAVFFDGVGWNPERFPGYGPMMRRINRAARVRGIKTGYAGYGSGYGPPELHLGPVFRNRVSYPGGEIYGCCGSPGKEHSRTMGTCLSNPGLLGLKQKNLIAFVRAVEPGFLYLHNLDVSRVGLCKKAWEMRCEKCRRTWPSDDISSGRGMAGAYAEFYNSLASAVNLVKNRTTGYEAARDTVMLMVGPNYSSSGEPDEEWQAHLDYFKTVGSRIEYENVSILIREQFLGRSGGVLRCRQISDIFKKSRSMVAVFHFFGGDMFYNSTPFLPVPAVTGFFKGVDGVFNGNGNAYQEPQQLFNAACLWNAQSSPYTKKIKPRSFKNFVERYEKLRSGEERPGSIYSPGGFLDAACKKLYGQEAGRCVAGIYRLRGDVKLDALPRYKAFTVPILPAWNKIMPVLHFSVFSLGRIEWKKQLGGERAGMLKLLYKAFSEIEKLQKKALALAARAARLCRQGTGAQEDLMWLAATLEDGLLLLRFMKEYLEVFITAHPETGSGHRNPAACLRRLKTLRKSLGETQKNFCERYPGPAIAPFGGDTQYRMQVVSWLDEEAGRMLHTLQTGEWPEHERKLEWW